MSVHVSSHVWKHSEASGTALLILLAIAEQANDEGIAWPGVARLAKRARTGERNVQLVVRKLEEAGELEVAYTAGRHRTNVYAVAGYRQALKENGETLAPLTVWIADKKVNSPSPNGGPAPDKKVKSSAQKGEIQRTEKVNWGSPEPSVKPSGEPSSTGEVVDKSPTSPGGPPIPAASPGGKEGEKPQDLKQFAVAGLMERVNAAKARGSPIHSPTDDERKQFARMFERAKKDGHEIDTLLLAFDYQVAKASGEMSGEPKAWCGYGTALDRVLEGWRPGRLLKPVPVKERREYDKHDVVNPETSEQVARLMREAGMDEEWLRTSGLG